MKKLDAEGVVAYVNEAIPYTKRSDAGKQEWCARVRKVLDSGWSQRELSPLLGVARSVIGERLAWSEGTSKSRDDHQEKRTQQKRLSHAKSVMRDLDASPELKADLIAEAQQDPRVHEVLQQRLREKGGAAKIREAHPPRFKVPPFIDAIMRATKALDEALVAVRDGEIPEGAGDLLLEAENRCAAIARALSGDTKPGLRRVQ